MSNWLNNIKKKSMSLWKKRPGLSVSIILFLAIVTLLILDIFIWNTEISGYLSGVNTNLVGILITVLFVEALFERKNKEMAMEKEARAILRSDKIAQQYISRYTLNFVSVITPNDKDIDEPIAFPDHFEFTDICDLYSISFFIINGLSESKIEIFYKMELLLRNHFISTLSNIDFDYFPDLENVLIGFVTNSIDHDARESILGLQHRTLGDKKATDFVRDALKKTGVDFYKKFSTGEKQNANLLHPLVFLYEMMKAEKELIVKYNDLIKRIRDQYPID